MFRAIFLFVFYAYFALAHAQSPEWEPVPTPPGAQIGYVFEHSSGTVLAFTWADLTDSREIYLPSAALSVFTAKPPFDHWNRSAMPVWVYDVVEVSSGHLFATAYGQIITSGDTGKTWQSIQTFGNGRLLGRGDKLVAVNDANTMMYSTDSGSTWFEQPSGLGAQFSQSRCNGYIDAQSRLAVTTRDGFLLRSSQWTSQPVVWDTLYSGGLKRCFLLPDSSILVVAEGVARSTDDGKTWMPYIAVGFANGGPYMAMTTNGDLFYITNEGLLLRVRYGSTTVDSLATKGLKLFAGHEVYLVSNSRMMRSTDLGDTWDDITGDLTLPSYFNIKRLRDGELMLNGRFGNYKTEQQGASWSHRNFFALETCLGPSSEVYALLDTALLASFDNGNVFTPAITPPFNPYLQSLTCLPNGDVYLAAPYRKSGWKDLIFISHDQGSSWDAFLEKSSNNIRSSKSGVLYFVDQILYRFQPGATRYDSIPLHPPDHPVFDPILITNNGGFIAQHEHGGMIRVDSGSIALDTFLFQPPDTFYHRPNCLAQDANDIIYAGDQYGLYRTSDMGATWTQFDSGIETRYIYDIYYDESDGRMLCTTPDGIYRTVLPVVVSAKDPPGITGFSLAQNYPNPSSSTTSIRYSLERGMAVTLAVYDRLGRELAVLTDGFQSAGAHSATFSTASLPPGVYAYRLRSPDGVISKLMVVAR